MAGSIHRHDGAGSAGHPTRRILGVQHVLLGLDVDEHGARPDIQDGVDARGKGERGHQDLRPPAHTRGPSRSRCSAAVPETHRDGMGTPAYSAMRCSNSSAPGPSAQRPERRTSGRPRHRPPIDIGRRHRDRAPRNQGFSGPIGYPCDMAPRWPAPRQNPGARPPAEVDERTESLGKNCRERRWVAFRRSAGTAVYIEIHEDSEHRRNARS